MKRSCSYTMGFVVAMLAFFTSGAYAAKDFNVYVLLQNNSGHNSYPLTPSFVVPSSMIPGGVLKMPEGVDAGYSGPFRTGSGASTVKMRVYKAPGSVVNVNIGSISGFSSAIGGTSCGNIVVPVSDNTSTWQITATLSYDSYKNNFIIRCSTLQNPSKVYQ